MNSKLSFAIAAILGGSSAGIGHAAPAADTEANSEAIQEITVTAQRRTENIQDVPISIRAMTGETLMQVAPGNLYITCGAECAPSASRNA